jgi:tRNA(fMet)-specific endonuclease VapC
MYLLDQTIILALLKGNNHHVLNNVDENLENCYIPAIVAAELYRMNYPRSKKDSMKKLIESFPMVEFGEAEAIEYSEIQQKLEQNGAAANIVDVMIAATALSLDATIVTHRVKQFNIIPQRLRVENWRTSDQVLSLYENEPGTLYQIAKLMQELNINIVEAYGGNNDTSQHSKRHSLIINVPYRNIPEKVQSRLNNVRYEPHQDQQQAKIEFDCIPTSQSPNKKFNAQGRDRVGLLADVTRLIAKEKVNIIVSGSRIGDDPESISEMDRKNFYISFYLYGNLNESEWQALLQEIKKVKDGDDQFIQADLNDI